jgi:hypothetical protein
MLSTTTSFISPQVHLLESLWGGLPAVQKCQSGAPQDRAGGGQAYF